MTIPSPSQNDSVKQVIDVNDRSLLFLNSDCFPAYLLERLRKCRRRPNFFRLGFHGAYLLIGGRMLRRKLELDHHCLSVRDMGLIIVMAFLQMKYSLMENPLTVGVECVFCWYWLADLCQAHQIPFVLGHALYMKAIHGGKTKKDKIDSYKIALLMKGGNFPTAYPYPSEWRATRDLLRRRMYISRRCSELVAHIQNTNTQYNLPAFGKKLSRKYNHTGVAERFDDPEVRKSVEVDLAMIESLNQLLKKLEWHSEKTARQHDFHTLYLLRSIPGVGQILALVILYEIHDIRRFPKVQDFFHTLDLFVQQKSLIANGPAIPTRK